MKKMFAAAALAGVMAFPLATTTSAQPQVVIGGGLVNVQITDVIDDVTVIIEDVNVGIGVAANLVANVCGVAVNVVAVQLAQGNTYECTGTINANDVDVVAQR